MDNDRLITVAIHTYDRAMQLKNLLEHQGIHAVLHNVNLSTPVVSSGVRVRIKETDLPQALRIIENADIFMSANPDENTKKLILVPVDFTAYSTNAVYLAFNLAARLKAEILLLHTYINPEVEKRVQLSDVLSFEIAENKEVGKELLAAADSHMDIFIDKLRTDVKDGVLPPVAFTTRIAEGVPEDVIDEVAKELSPILIVMGTRCYDRKERELIGSVTAEVLDTCRLPVLTIPENIDYKNLMDNRKLMFFGNIDQEDILAMDAVYHLFPTETFDITVVDIARKKEENNAIDSLLGYFRNLYAGYRFESALLSSAKAADEIASLIKDNPNELIVLPNKKRNAFRRFFNPSIAHRMLLRTDTPMLVIPV